MPLCALNEIYTYPRHKWKVILKYNVLGNFSCHLKNIHYLISTTLATSELLRLCSYWQIATGKEVDQSISLTAWQTSFLEHETMSCRQITNHLKWCHFFTFLWTSPKTKVGNCILIYANKLWLQNMLPSIPTKKLPHFQKPLSSIQYMSWLLSLKGHKRWSKICTETNAIILDAILLCPVQEGL